MPPVSRLALVHQIDAALAASKALDSAGLKAQSRAAVARADAIQNVVERLDAYAAAVVYNPRHACQIDVRREHASHIVDAVAALLKERP